jgi:hypothetical protein
MTLVLKGRHKGLVLNWSALVSGDAALAAALNASLTANLVPKRIGPKTTEPETRKPATTRRARKGKSTRLGSR